MTRPYLRVLRDSAPPPPLELPRAQVRVRRRDSVARGVAVVVSLLAGAVLISLAMGWVR